MSEIRTTAEISEIFGALAKAQGELENVEKSGKNPAFHAKYAKLGALLDEVRPKFARHGISICQAAINGDDGAIGVITRLCHVSGQWMESVLYVKPTRFDAQGVGSVITYLRRYTLLAMAGIAPDDDDGNAAMDRPASQTVTTKVIETARPPAAVNGAVSHVEHPRRAAALDAYRRINHALNLAKTTPEAADLFRVHKANLALIGEVSPETYKGLAKRFGELGIDIAAEAARREPEYLGADETERALS